MRYGGFRWPDGEPFFLVGCDACDWHESGYSTPLQANGKPRKIAEPLPDPQRFRAAYRNGKVCFLGAALQRKLGEASCSFGKARHVMETTMS